MSERRWLQQDIPDEVRLVLSSARDDDARVERQRERLQSRLLGLGISAGAAPSTAHAPVSSPADAVTGAAAHTAQSSATAAAGAGSALLAGGKLGIAALCCTALVGTLGVTQLVRTWRSEPDAVQRTRVEGSAPRTVPSAAEPVGSVHAGRAADAVPPDAATAELSSATQATQPTAQRPARTSASATVPLVAATPVTSARPSASLRQELRLIEAMRAALPAAPASVLRFARKHTRDFPNGALVAERELLRIEALLLERQTRAAAIAVRQFERRYPDSIYTRRALRLLSDARGVSESND